jgi:hypothetical protein
MRKPSSFSLDKNVLEILREVSDFSGISMSSIVQTAVLFWHAEKGDEWRKTFSRRANVVPNARRSR